jgi:hypothetical protein
LAISTDCPGSVKSGKNDRIALTAPLSLSVRIGQSLLLRVGLLVAQLLLERLLVQIVILPPAEVPDSLVRRISTARASLVSMTAS